MTGSLVLILLAAAPIVVTLLLSANGALVYLALCEGSIIDKTLGSDAIDALHTFFPRTSSIQQSTLHLILLLLPALLTAIFLRRQMAGAKSLFNIAPAVLTGATTALFVVPLLPGGVRYEVMNTTLWTNYSRFEGVIVGAGALISLLLIWTNHAKRHGRRRNRA